MERWIYSSLAYAGIGAFFGFLIVVFGYSLTREYLVYSIYAGALLGFAFGAKIREELVSSPVSFLAGAVFTSVMVLSWTYGFSPGDVLKVLYALAVVLGLAVKPKSFGDSLLTLPAYLGGFALLLQAFRGYAAFQETENALTSVIVSSGKLSVLLLSACLVRWALEKFWDFTKGNV
jgi:hypothetical protein